VFSIAKKGQVFKRYTAVQRIACIEDLNQETSEKQLS